MRRSFRLRRLKVMPQNTTPTRVPRFQAMRQRFLVVDVQQLETGRGFSLGRAEIDGKPAGRIVDQRADDNRRARVGDDLGLAGYEAGGFDTGMSARMHWHSPPIPQVAAGLRR